MKQVKFYLIFLSLGLLMFSCQKEGIIQTVPLDSQYGDEVVPDFQWGDKAVSAYDTENALGTAGLRDDLNQLEFDELLNKPVDGLNFRGVHFAFEVGGSRSMDANYNAFGPNPGPFVNCPCIEGDANGTLTIEFEEETEVVEFGVALSTGSNLSPGFTVKLYDDDDDLIDEFDINTSPAPTFSGGQFSYDDEDVKKVEVTFNHNFAFAFDNLVYEYDDDDDDECEGDVELCGEQEVPSVDTDGGGEFTYELDGDELEFELSAEDMNSNVTQAHIHYGPCGQNGPVVAFLFGFIPGGDEADGEFADGTLTDADLIGPLSGMTIADLCAEIEAGWAYINVHSVSAPGGELRGQLGDPDCDCDSDADDDDDDDDDDDFSGGDEAL